MAAFASSNPHVTSIIAVMATYGIPTPPSPEAIKLGYQVSYRDLPPGSSKTVEQKEFKLPISYFEDGKQYDKLSAWEACTKPKLIIYGTQDAFTEPSKVKDVYQSMPVPKMIHEVDSEHDYRLHPEVIEEVNQTIGNFLGQYK